MFVITTNGTYPCHRYSITDNQVMMPTVNFLINTDVLCHGAAKGWCWFGIFYLTLPVSKQEALSCKNGCFCYLYTESLFFIWLLWFFLMNSLGKSLSEKFMALLCHYYSYWHKSSPKCVNCKVLTCPFFVQFLYSYFLQNDHLNGLLICRNFCCNFSFLKWV